MKDSIDADSDDMCPGNIDAVGLIIKCLNFFPFSNMLPIGNDNDHFTLFDKRTPFLQFQMNTADGFLPDTAK